MKRFILGFTALLVSIIAFIPLTDINASMAVDPTVIGALGDLGYGLVGGASFDFTDSQYTVENWSSLEELEEDARVKAYDFLRDYAIARGIQFNGYNTDVPLTEKDFYRTYYFDSTVKQNWQKYQLAQNEQQVMEAMRFPFSASRFADWTQYNEFWIEKYASDFDSSTEETPEVVVPEQYLSVIDTINGSGASRVLNWSQSYVWGVNDQNAPIQIPVINRYPLSDYSIMRQNYSTTNQTTWNYAQNIVICPIQTININSSGTNFYLATVSAPAYDAFNVWTGGANQPLTQVATALFRFDLNTDTLNNISSTNPTAQTFWTQTMSGTLDSILERIAINCRNVNIYVDGEPWSLVNDGDNAPANPLIPTFPDVITGDYDDLAYDVVVPVQGDNAFDLTSLLDTLTQAIIGASDLDDTTSGVLDRDRALDDGLVKDEAGEDAITEDKPIAEVLDDALPIEATADLPVIPFYPQPVVNGLSGISILAKIVDATQCSLPIPIMTVFWGIVFILIFLGVINLLHR